MNISFLRMQANWKIGPKALDVGVGVKVLPKRLQIREITVDQVERISMARPECHPSFAAVEKFSEGFSSQSCMISSSECSFSLLHGQ